MNEQTVKILKEIAEKLGVTAEYLWSAMLRQAPIDSAVGLFFIIANIVAAAILYKLHVKFDKEDTYDTSDAAVVLIGVGSALVAVFLIASFFMLPTIIAGFVNPEYWALNKLLN